MKTNQRFSTWLALPIFLIAIVCSGHVQAANGDLDPSFNASVFDKGTVTTMARQTDGKVVVAGTFSAINGVIRQNVARLNADGTLDTTFDPGSQIVGEVDGVAVQSDGKVLLGGYGLLFTGFGQSRYRQLLRLNANGSIDPTFYAPTGVDANSNVDVIKVLPNGQLLIGGSFTQYDGTDVRRLARLNADGSLDTSFNLNAGVDGLLTSGNSVYAIAFQSDGKILIGGVFNSVNSARSPNFARLNADASVDNTFFVGDGPNGQTTNLVASIAIQNDGKIVIGGLFLNYDTTKRNGFARVNADGSLDTAFNNGIGIAGNPTVFAVTIQTDNKILIAGDIFGYNNVVRGRVARINSDGSLDTTFDPGQGFNGTVVGLILQPDGKLVLGGAFTRYQNTTARTGLARLNSDSSLDPSFTASAFNRATIRQIAVQSDGKILIGGDFVSVNGSPIFNLTRLNSDGTLDNLFATTEADSTVNDIVLQADGKILVCGKFARRLVRLNTDGSRDTTFSNQLAGGQFKAIALQPDGTLIVASGVSGIAKLDANGAQSDAAFNLNVGFGADDIVYAVTLQSDGKILIGGDFSSFNNTSEPGIARLNANGSLDSSFNIGAGFVGAGGVRSLALQPDGKVIAGGHFESFNGTSRNKVARLNVNGSLDTGFDPGTGATNFGSNFVEKVLLQPSGKILIGGDIKNYNGTACNGLVRVNTNGSLDAGFNAAAGSSVAETVAALAMQADGKLLVGGGFLTFNATNAGSLVRLLADGAPTPTSQLLNISTRMRVLTGEQVLIAGFIITGTDPKKVIIRGMGPSLSGVGVTLSDPTLELHQGSTTLATNDNWKINDQTGQSQETDIRATTIPPSNDLESAILVTLSPGAYTAILAGKNGGTGVGLVEVYDLAQGANSKLANISTRGFVDTGDNVMIGGLIVGGGSGGGTAKVIVRALGPSVPVAGALADPTLELHNANGTMIVTNDNWKINDQTGQSQEADIRATTIPPPNDLESAIVATLPPDNYTAIVRGKNNTTGIGLVEAYNLQ